MGLGALVLSSKQLSPLHIILFLPIRKDDGLFRGLSPYSHAQEPLGKHGVLLSTSMSLCTGPGTGKVPYQRAPDE